MTYNALEYVKRCLTSVSTCSADYHEVIVVDNASSEPTRNYLKSVEKSGSIRLILNEENRLWSPANNQGLRLISKDSRYCLLLNSDIEVFKPDWMSKLQAPMFQYSSVGITGTQFNFLPMKPMYGAIDGCCFMFRRELIEQIGYLDENYPWNGAGFIYCVKAWAKGWYFYHVDHPTLVVHYGKKSRMDSFTQLKNENVDCFQIMRESGLKPKYDLISLFKNYIHKFDVNQQLSQFISK